MKFMKKVLVMLLITMMMINVIPVHAVTYSEYKKGDKIKVKVNDKDTFEFYVLEDSGSSSDTVKAIYSDVLSGTFNYENATKKVTSLKDTWKNVSSIALPKMEDIFGSSVNLTKFFEYTTQTWALSSSRYWTSNKEKANAINLLNEKILNDNIVQADTNIDFSKISSDTNGKGLYKTNINTEDEKTTYYFRGDVNNNYVKFAKNTDGEELYWRIMRINEDGSIRLIYSGIGETEQTTDGKVIDKNVVLPLTMAYNATLGGYSNYMYSVEGTGDDKTFTDENMGNSTVKQYIDGWYSTNLRLNYSEYLSMDAGFCNDRTDTSETHDNVEERVQKNKPQFKCPDNNHDLFTNRTSITGNKALEFSIGLPTADDLIYAGAVYGETNNTFYLYNEVDFWTMSPAVYGEQLYVISDGYLDTSSSVKYPNEVGFVPGNNPNVESYDMHARPVINLKATVEVSHGDGTHDNPYVINTGESSSAEIEIAWTLGGATKGTAQTETLTNTLSVKPVITVSKQYVEGNVTTPDDGNTDGDDDDGDGTTTPDDGDDGKGDGTTTPDDEPKNPSTGDNVIVIIGSTIILGCLAVYAYRRKVNN